MTRPSNTPKVSFLPVTKKEFWPYYALAIAMFSTGASLAFASAQFPALVTAIVALSVPLSLTDSWKSGGKFHLFISGEVLIGLVALGLAFSSVPTWLDAGNTAWVVPGVAGIVAGISHAIRTPLQK